ncbi:hypothetical protein RhiJN_17371 [Ceratobasidium sp. AG-Ba]|nr:hypothetical protein RhiJN_17371 [Ceratobasidium sp. AG-Ba]
MSMRTRGQLKHKFALKKMRLPADHTPHLAPRVVHSPLVTRDEAGGSTENAGGMDPVMLVGICLAGVTLLILAIGILVRRLRKRADAARTMERGIKVARTSVNGNGKPEMQQAWRGSAGGNASDDTHVVDFVYGDKVRSSFESSDYNALSTNLPKSVSRSAVTASVILPTPAATRPGLKAIDVQRANNPFSSPLAGPPTSTSSSVQNFYGPAIARARSRPAVPEKTQSESRSPGLHQASAMRALAVAAGVAAAADEEEKGEDKDQDKKKSFELPVYFSPFRASTFAGGMKLGEHLGIQTAPEKDHPESVRSQDSKWFSQDSTSVSHPPSSPKPNQESRVVPPSPGARPGTAGTFGQPIGSFAGRIPYKTTGKHRHAASSLSIADVRSVRVSYASGLSSPIAGGFRGHSPTPSLSHGRTQSTGSAMGVAVRKVQTVFPPLLPDELVLRIGEKVTLLQTFDDEWCVVGRDRFGEVEVGAVPAFVFTKAKSGEAFDRPMRSTSLGVQVEMSSAPGAVWSSREEVISWSNF